MHDKRTALIGLDWGTTSLRAYRLGQGGRILDFRASEAGILRVAGGDFTVALNGSEHLNVYTPTGGVLMIVSPPSYEIAH